MKNAYKRELAFHLARYTKKVAEEHDVSLVDMSVNFDFLDGKIIGVCFVQDLGVSLQEQNTLETIKLI